MHKRLHDLLSKIGDDDKIILTAGIMGMLGCVVVVATHFISLYLLDSFDPIQETISDLAAGRYGSIFDFGLVIYALSLIVCAWGLYRWKLSESLSWWLGLILLVVLGLDIFIIAIYNEYGNRDSGGVVIHIYFVYILGFSFAATVLLLGRGFRHVHRHLWWQSVGLAVAWLILAPPFVLIDFAWVGLYERLLAALMLIWSGCVSWLLIRRGRQRHST